MILKLLAELKTEVKELKVAVQLIQQQQNRTVQPIHVQEEFVFPEGVVLPVADLPGLQKLEEELKSSKALQNHLVCTFMTALCCCYMTKFYLTAAHHNFNTVH